MSKCCRTCKFYEERVIPVCDSYSKDLEDFEDHHIDSEEHINDLSFHIIEEHEHVCKFMPTEVLTCPTNWCGQYKSKYKTKEKSVKSDFREETNFELNR